MFKTYAYIFVLSFSFSLVCCKKDDSSQSNVSQSSNQHIESEDFIKGFKKRIKNIANSDDDHSPHGNDKLLSYQSHTEAVEPKHLKTFIQSQLLAFKKDLSLLNEIHNERPLYIKNFKGENPNHIFYPSFNVADSSSQNENKSIFQRIQSAFSRLGELLKFSAEKISKRFHGLYGHQNS